MRGDEILEHAVEAAPLYVSQFEDFGRAARGDADPVVTLADSRGNTAALLAVLEAAHGWAASQLSPPRRPAEPVGTAQDFSKAADRLKWRQSGVGDEDPGG